MEMSHARILLKKEVAAMADCTKIKYPNPWAATHALRFLAQKYAARALKVPVAIYPCGACRTWHLTSKAQRGKSRKWNVSVC